MKFAVLALTLLLAVASQAAVVPGEEPSDMQLRYTAFKDMVEQVKNMLDRAIVNSPDSQELHTPSIISQGLGNFHALLNTHEDAVVASVSATREILSQMSGAGELSGELQAGINNLDAIFKTHLAEYNILLMPIVTEFKQASMKFSEAVAPKVADLRAEFRSNLPETLNAMGHVMRTVLKMVKNFRDAANEYVEEYRRGAEEYYRAVERMTPEQRELKKAEMEQIGQEIVAKFQKLFDVARGVAESR